MTKIRIGRPVVSHLEGSGAWQGESGHHPAEVSLVQKMQAMKARKDGSITVTLELPEMEYLADHVEILAMSAAERSADGCYRFGDIEMTEALADLRSSRAVLRKLYAAGVAR